MAILDLLSAEPDRSRWPEIKCREIAKAVPRLDRTARAKGLEVEIVDVQHPGGNFVEVLVRAWQDGQQIGFGQDGTVDIERVRIVIPAILVPDPAGPIVSTWTDDDGNLKERRLREDARAALLHDVEHTITVKREKLPGSNRIVRGRVGRTTLTARPLAGTGTAPMDAGFHRGGVDELFATIIAGAGTTLVDTAAAGTVGFDSRNPTSANSFNDNAHMAFGFDTSSIGSDDISSAILTLTDAASNTLTQVGDPQLALVEFTPTDPAALAASDYAISQYGTTDLMTRANMADWNSSSGTNAYTLNAAGLAAINKSGNTYLGFVTGDAIDGTLTGPYAKGRSRINTYQADQFGTTDDPVMVCEHAAGGLTISPSGIASGEAFGTGRLDLNLAPGAIGSAEAFGAQRLDLEIAAGAIASAEAFGTAQLDLGLLMAAIASAEAFGTARLDINVTAAGIASEEAFGDAVVSLGSDQSITGAGAIASAEAFGTAQLDLLLFMAGIASLEAFGDPIVSLGSDQSITGAGAIASSEAFGTARIDFDLLMAAIASSEAFGTAQLDINVTAAGIASEEAFGAGRIDLELAAAGIASEEAFGSPQLDLLLLMQAIASSEAFGSHQVLGGQTILDIVERVALFQLILAQAGSFAVHLNEDVEF